MKSGLVFAVMCDVAAFGRGMAANEVGQDSKIMTNKKAKEYQQLCHYS